MFLTTQDGNQDAICFRPSSASRFPSPVVKVIRWPVSPEEKAMVPPLAAAVTAAR
jgi:hypothetical protein